MSLSGGGVTIVAATSVEARAVRRVASLDVRVVESGIALRKQARFDGLAISCGLAGGLRDGVPTGTVLVPQRVRRPDGSELLCDDEAVRALTDAAQQLGFAVLTDPLVTASTLVYGSRRAALAAQGFAGVDMETGVISASRVACVRVILDTPQREISPVWLTPVRAVFAPRAWIDLPFLMREGPRCSAIAANIAARAAQQLN
ncbi:MAG TPA: hypothetical protein VFH72_01770 [Candidatus Baltobacteraceae bacterium]|nr:hypothetical protein [Candidatus Baltobacteraceae bacterium]